MKEPSMVVCLLIHKTIYTVSERIGNKWVTIKEDKKDKPNKLRG